MEIENEVPDPPNVLIENISEDRIEPIAVDIDEIPFDDCKLSLPVVMTNAIWYTIQFSPLKLSGRL